MKNLMIAAVLSLGTMTAFAQEENAVEDAGNAVEETATEATDATTDAAEETYDAAQDQATEATESMEDSANEATDAMSQDNFNEVATDEVPEAITSALEEAHPGATIDKASVNDQSQYKLEVTKEDGETTVLYSDAEGNWIDM